MNKFKNLIMILSNISFIIAFNITANHFNLMHPIIIILLDIFLVLIGLVPLIIKVDIVKTRKSWEKSFLFFWKRQYFQLEITKQTSVLGLWVLKKEIIMSAQTFRTPPITVIAQDTYNSISIFFPIINTLVSIANIASQTKKLIT